MKLTDNFTRGLGKAKLSVKKASPTLLIVGGAIIGVVAIVDYCKKSINEAAPIIEESNEKIDIIEENAREELVEPNKEEISKIKKSTAVKLCKVYARPVGLTVVSAVMIGGSHYILKKRNVALAAAFTAVDSGFKMYRQRVIERFGDEVDKELRYNIKKHTIEEKYIDPETGEERIKETEVGVIETDPNDPNKYSIYARFFDQYCTEWSKSPEYNLTFLRARQAEANQILQRDGYLFLNTVYDMLGIPRSKAGQVVGWVYKEDNPVGDNFVDFGIYDVRRSANRDFVNGYENVILLDFNIDGDILDYLP